MVLRIPILLYGKVLRSSFPEKMLQKYHTAARAPVIFALIYLAFFKKSWLKNCLQYNKHAQPSQASKMGRSWISRACAQT